MALLPTSFVIHSFVKCSFLLILRKKLIMQNLKQYYKKSFISFDRKHFLVLFLVFI